MAVATSNIVPPTIAGPVLDTRRPKLRMPKGACDCHAHLFGPQTKYAYDPKRRYTPPDATLSDYIKMLGILGVERGVLVQPSVYMTDNAVMLDALAENRFPLRGVVVVNPTVSDAELQKMHELGVRGIRLNLRFENGASANAAPELGKRIAKLGWHLQFRINPEDFPTVEKMLESLPVDVVVDHIGQVPIKEGLEGASFRSLLRLVRGGRCWVKLSAPMRMSEGELPYADVTSYVQALVDANASRMIWATDWPHTTITKKMPNDGDLADLLLDWIPDQATRDKVLSDNPAHLYGF